MTKLHDFAFKDLYDKITIIDQRTEQNRIERSQLIKESGISQDAYNYRVRTKKF